MSTKRWIGCPIEDEFFGDDLKIAKIERKRRAQKDRSKFKKTDIKKFEKSIKDEIRDRREKKQVLIGRVLSISSRGVIVDHEGETYACSLRGLLKKERTQLKNLVAVGDFVYFEKLPDCEGMITDVKARHSILSRADNLSRKKEQIIATNIDQVLITVSIMSPPLKPQIIDRYILAAKKGNMQPVILVNKIDLLEKMQIGYNECEILKLCEEAYESVGIPLIKLSALERKGLDQLEQVMKNKSSVFSGQSGTGKSSLINAMTSGNLKVGETVKKTRKGAHTTTSAQLIPLPCGGFCIDTPGIKSFGLWNFEREDLKNYFVEIQNISQDCKFPDCTHIHEDQCAVIEAFENGDLSPLRYQSYISLMDTLNKKHLRR